MHKSREEKEANPKVVFPPAQHISKWEANKHGM